MKPILLKGHERSITQVLFNREGDLIFTTSKDHKPCVFFANSGERLGTFNGHTGAVWGGDVDFFSERFLTCAGDSTVRLWRVNGGECLKTFKLDVAGRSVKWNMGDTRFMVVTDAVMKRAPTIRIYDVAKDIEDQTDEPLGVITGDVKITQCEWGPLNETILAASEDGDITVYDAETGEVRDRVNLHNKSITSLAKSVDGEQLITGSQDHRARMVDTRTLTVLKTYETSRPVNTAALHPTRDIVLVAGGQDAMEVTQTSGRIGGFLTRFFSKTFENELGTVKGHFGPVHSGVWHPDGGGFATGGEDGFTRIHRLDDEFDRVVKRQSRLRD